MNYFLISVRRYKKEIFFSWHSRLHFIFPDLKYYLLQIVSTGFKILSVTDCVLQVWKLFRIFFYFLIEDFFWKCYFSWSSCGSNVAAIAAAAAAAAKIFSRRPGHAPNSKNNNRYGQFSCWLFFWESTEVVISFCKLFIFSISIFFS